MRLVFALLPLLAACRKSEPITAPEIRNSGESACRTVMFEGSRFTACDPKRAQLELHTGGRDGRPYRSFAALEHVLGSRADDVLFAMNAGMFDENGDPIGLAVASGRELHPINRREGSGNFHLMPNGAFLVRKNGSAAVITSKEYSSEGVALATQSGPMLVIDGKLHPRFEADGRSRFIRNGVGIGKDGQPVFVISDEPVLFGKLARFFRDELGCRNALYFDGSVSSLWDPANARMDSYTAIGPMIVAFGKH